MDNVVIVTDSASDLSREFMSENNVRFLPMLIDINGEIFSDNINISSEEFFKKIQDRSVFPKTSQPNPSSFEEVFSEELAKGNEVICITISSGLSGTYNSACLAKNLVDSNKIHIIDSKVASSGEGLLVAEAVKLAKSCNSIEEILNRLDNMVRNMNTLIVVDSLEMLRRGGRIKDTAATIGSLLNLKPLLTVTDGSVSPYGKVRGAKAAFKKMIAFLEEKEVNSDSKIVISHAQNIDGANDLKKRIEEQFGVSNVDVFNMGPTIGTYSDIGALAVFATRE